MWWRTEVIHHETKAAHEIPSGYQFCPAIVDYTDGLKPGISLHGRVVIKCGVNSLAQCPVVVVESHPGHDPHRP